MLETKILQGEDSSSDQAQRDAKTPRPLNSRKEEKNNVRISSVKIGELKCLQTNAESLMNKMDEFKLVVTDEQLI